MGLGTKPGPGSERRRRRRTASVARHYMTGDVRAHDLAPDIVASHTALLGFALPCPCFDLAPPTGCFGCPVAAVAAVAANRSRATDGQLARTSEIWLTSARLNCGYSSTCGEIKIKIKSFESNRAVRRSNERLFEGFLNPCGKCSVNRFNCTFELLVQNRWIRDRCAFLFVRRSLCYWPHFFF